MAVVMAVVMVVVMAVAVAAVMVVVEGKEVVVAVTTARAQDQDRRQTVLPVLPGALVVVMVTELRPSRAVPRRGGRWGIITGVCSLLQE